MRKSRWASMLLGIMFILMTTSLWSKTVVTRVGNSADSVTTGLKQALAPHGGGLESDAVAIYIRDNLLGKSSPSNKAGDVVILRVDTSTGYNSWLYTDIGGFDSVTTISLSQAKDATNLSTTNQNIIKNAEWLIIPGGDQKLYVTYWRGTPVETCIEYILNTKKGVVSGASAGTAILSEYYFSANFTGTLRSVEALANPYGSKITIGNLNNPTGDFLVPVQSVGYIYETHYDDGGGTGIDTARDGRLFTFMARINKDKLTTIKGIGFDRGTMMVIEKNATNQWVGKVFNNASSQIGSEGCAWVMISGTSGPEVCVSGSKVTWDRGGQAVRYIKLKGTANGTTSFNFSTNIASGDFVDSFVYAQNGVLKYGTGVTKPD